MDDAESISVLSEGTAAVNAYGSIIEDHEETDSGAIEVWSRSDDGGSLSIALPIALWICKGYCVVRSLKNR